MEDGGGRWSGNSLSQSSIDTCFLGIMACSFNSPNIRSKYMARMVNIA